MQLTSTLINMSFQVSNEILASLGKCSADRGYWKCDREVYHLQINDVGPQLINIDHKPMYKLKVHLIGEVENQV